MKPITLVFYLLFVGNLEAQNLGTDSLLPPLRILKVSIADLVDLSSPSFLLSFEHGLGADWSILAEGGVIGLVDILNRPLKGYKARGELRWYCVYKASPSKYFLGLQYMWKQFEEANVTGEFRLGNKLPYTYKTFDYDFSKRVDAVHLSFGGFTLHNRSVLEFAVFVGVRKRVPSFEGVPDEYRYYKEPNKFLTFRQSKPDVWPSVGFTFRAGFKL